MAQSIDTIAAIATARGRAALSIVRVSGPDATAIVDSCMPGVNLRQTQANTAQFARFGSDPANTLDEVVVTVFHAPRSSTGEDLVEISCHGGDVASQLILNEVVRAGARLAEPGEFTKRAFLNGKMDLAQAEAVADLIHASSTAAHRNSLSQLTGRYSETLKEIREQLIGVLALIELELDFSEEDVEFADRQKVLSLLERVNKVLSDLTDSYLVGKFIRDGVHVSIVGRPNVGKSTLLNALVGRDRAIVSDIPGTTRDEIEASAELDGLRFVFTDTAGIREAQDTIEAEGVRRAERSAETADIVLFVYDRSAGLSDEESQQLSNIADHRAGMPLIIVANKEDLVAGEPHTAGKPDGVVRVSALKALSDEAVLDELVARLVKTVRQDQSDQESSQIVTNQRHFAHLEKALGSIQSAQEGLAAGSSGETVSLELRAALLEIGSVIGEVTNEDVLGAIFSRFCIGK